MRMQNANLSASVHHEVEHVGRVLKNWVGVLRQLGGYIWSLGPTSTRFPSANKARSQATRREITSKEGWEELTADSRRRRLKFHGRVPRVLEEALSQAEQ